MSFNKTQNLYKPDCSISEIAKWIGTPVHSASFPKTKLRFRNDYWAKKIGLADLTDERWIAHFGRFEPLPQNLPEPLALKYHGHQFRVYNPEIGDGRGFLFAQIRDGSNRLLDFGTKGSGQTPYSRLGDGRLTLKGAVREILATEMLEALGVYTSKTFSVIETGEPLTRSDEPSPARSAVMVRLSHGHIRIGSFQRLMAIDDRDNMEQLVNYCLKHYPGGLPPEDLPGHQEPPVILFNQVVERMADLAASWMVAGFVHGVLNTDNMNISGESFDYGPWRFLPRWDPTFTAAYFDHQGLYSFGRQPEALHWNCGQLAVALRLLCDSEPLLAVLNRFGPLYMKAIAKRWCWRLGVRQISDEQDAILVAASEKFMREKKMGPDQFFYQIRCGHKPSGDLDEILEKYRKTRIDHEYWALGQPQSMHIDEVESIWASIEQKDDWSLLNQKVSLVRNMGIAHKLNID
jgi:uncharacterized protein YdiU (UPF0061 family)